AGAEQLLVLARRDGVGGLWGVDLGDLQWTLLVDLGLDYGAVDPESLVVAPDARFAAWLQGTEVELLDLETGQLRNLTTLGDPDAMPSFAWDGASLLYFEAYESGGGGLTAGLPGPGAAAFGLLKYIERMAWLYDLETGSTTEAFAPFARRGVLTPWPDWMLALEAGEGLFLSLIRFDTFEFTELDGFSSGNSGFLARPAVSPSGHLFLAIDGEARRYTPEGHFTVRDQPLAPGVNRFSATDGVSDSESIAIEVEEQGPPQPPDFALELAAAPLMPFAGGSTRITAVVQNVGPGVSEVTDLYLVLERPDGTVTELAPFELVPTLAAGDSHLVGFDVELTLPGPYRVAGAVDTADLIVEADETNNAAEVTFRALDPSGGVALGLVTDASVYGRNSMVEIEALV
ncbi:MAG: CARDB domain-containing protein, partial [Acidobacteriota bacterium]